MSEMKVECGFCGHAFTAQKENIGSSIACPACGRPTLTVAEGAKTDSGRLQLKEQAGAGTTRKDCPVCGSAADEDAVICTNCGYNWRSGQVQKQLVKMSSGQWKSVVPYLVVAVIGAAIGYSVGIRQSAMSGSALPPAVPAVSEESQDAPTPVDREGLGETQQTPADGAMSAEQEQADEAAVEDQAFDEDDTEGLSEERLAEYESRYRQRLHAQLDQRQPVFEKNQEVAVLKIDGMVLRGTYLGVKGDILVLAQESGILEIPLKEVNRETRVRCDRKFRDSVVEQKVKTRMRQIRERQ